MAAFYILVEKLDLMNGALSLFLLLGIIGNNHDVLMAQGAGTHIRTNVLE